MKYLMLFLTLAILISELVSMASSWHMWQTHHWGVRHFSIEFGWSTFVVLAASYFTSVGVKSLRTKTIAGRAGQ